MLTVNLNAMKKSARTYRKSCTLRFYAIAAFSLFTALPFSVYAADSAKPAPVVTANPLNMIWGLLFLLAIVGAGWWLVKRAGGLQINGGSMKVIAALSIGPRERVVLIEVAGEQWLLGVAPGCVNLLHRFEQPIVAANSEDFSSKIRQLMQQGLGK